MYYTYVHFEQAQWGKTTLKRHICPIVRMCRLKCQKVSVVEEMLCAFGHFRAPNTTNLHEYSLSEVETSPFLHVLSEKNSNFALNSH